MRPDLPTGAVRRNIELDDDVLGFMAAIELNPQKARILLHLVLARTTEIKAIQRFYEEH